MDARPTIFKPATRWAPGMALGTIGTPPEPAPGCATAIAGDAF